MTAGSSWRRLRLAAAALFPQYSGQIEESVSLASRFLDLSRSVLGGMGRIAYELASFCGSGCIILVVLSRTEILAAAKAALPVVAGYIGIGLPCGIMEQQVGFSALQAFITSVLLYAGAGQFMLAGMWITGAPIATIAASVSAVNLRQILYSASLSKHCGAASKKLAFGYSASVTDETFGVNIQRFESGDWKVSQALLVNAFSGLSWASANAAGVLLGQVLSIPVAIGSFAMTSIFICLLLTQKMTKVNVVVAAAAFLGVVVCKLAGLSSVAIVAGAVIGVGCGLEYMRFERRGVVEYA